jgi:hypothetical protein
MRLQDIMQLWPSIEVDIHICMPNVVWCLWIVHSALVVRFSLMFIWWINVCGWLHRPIGYEKMICCVVFFSDNGLFYIKYMLILWTQEKRILSLSEVDIRRMTSAEWTIQRHRQNWAENVKWRQKQWQANTITCVHSYFFPSDIWATFFYFLQYFIFLNSLSI